MSKIYIAVFGTLLVLWPILGMAQNTINGYEYVDLGLPSGLLWATCNLGASSPKDAGDSYSYGEIVTKKTYSTNNYTGKTWYSPGNLDSSKDAATCKMGKPWRMPTKGDFEELLAYTTQIEASNGYYFKSKVNGRQIFFLTAGVCGGVLLYSCASYWCSYASGNKCYFLIWSTASDRSPYVYEDEDGFYMGYSIRAVAPPRQNQIPSSNKTYPYTEKSSNAYGETEYTYYANGKVEVVSTTYCGACGKTGNCLQCGGTGYMASVTMMLPCPICGGTRKCQYCHGMGKTVSVSSFYQNSGAISTSSASMGTVMSYDNNTNNTGASTKTSTRRTCPGCHGTGKGISRVEYAARYTSELVYCSECNKADYPHAHIHEPCRVCFGKGFVE